MITQRRILRLFFVMLIPALILCWGPANLDRDGWRLLARALVTLSPQAVVSAQTFNRYVKADGLASGTCSTPETACTWEYAITVVPCAQTISIAPGTYNYVNGYMFKAFCTETTRRDWRGQGTVISTGIVESPPHTAWTLSNDCGGPCQYTYEMPFDAEAKGYRSSGVDGPFIAHQAGANVPPIRVAEHNLGGGVGLQSHEQVPFAFTTATPAYHRVESVAQVELQFGTYLYLNKKILAHFYEDTGPPRADMRIGIGRSNAGAIIMDGGSGERFENIQFWYALTGGYCIQLTQQTKWIVLSNITTKGCAWAISGDGHLIERPWAEVFYGQGRYTPPSPGGIGCYDANPTFGRNECFNQDGGGDQFNIVNATNITVRNGLSEKSWGGLLNIINSRNVLVEDFEARWSPNHLCGVLNTDDVTLRRVQCLSAQEATYSQETADHGNRRLRIENSALWPNAFQTGLMDRDNSMYNTVFFAPLSIGATGIATWKGDCNVAISPNENAENFVFEYRPGGPTYTLTQWQQKTGNDLHSKVLPASRGWATQFRTWTMNLKPWVVAWDLRPASSAVDVVNLDPACTPRYAGPFASPMGTPPTGPMASPVGVRVIP
jgi:hypothetical protein